MSSTLLGQRHFSHNVASSRLSSSRGGSSSGCCRPPQSRTVRVFAKATAGGFGKSNKKKVTFEGGMVVPKEGKRVKSLAEELDDQQQGSSSSRSTQGTQGAPVGFPTNWVDLKVKATDVPVGKNTKPLILASGKALMLYKFDDMVFVSDANSSAYQYPMTDARVFRDSATGAVAAEVPLDGSVYDLATGAVLKWCPKDNPVRSLLGTLKSKVDPSPLKVYPVYVNKDGGIWTTLL